MNSSDISERSMKRGMITESMQKQAQKISSPVMSDFLIASRRGFTTQVLQALKEGGAAKASTTDKHGRNCLQLAAIHGHFQTVIGILQTNLVDIDAVNKRGLTALHDACTEGHTNIALLLLSMGASVMAQTKDGWTCLMSASSSGHLQLAKILVAAGCDVTAQTKLGLTALHIAAWKGHTGVVNLLLQSGCNPFTVSHGGKTALQLATDENQYECATILNAAVSKTSEDPMYRISSLEGQLRQCQNKLTETIRSYDSKLTKQQLNSKELIETIQREHDVEMKQTLQRIENLEKKMIELDKSVKEESQLVKDTAQPPPLQPKSPTRRKRRSRNKEECLTPNTSKPELKVVPSPESNPQTTNDPDLLNPNDRPKSASYGDLTTIVKDEKSSNTFKLPNTPQVSPANTKKNIDKKAGRRESSDRSTITALVAESLSNPASMLAIKKELKSDSFTPKIQRKFPHKSSGSQAALVSMNAVMNGGVITNGSDLSKEGKTK